MTNVTGQGRVPVSSMYVREGGCVRYEEGVGPQDHRTKTSTETRGMLWWALYSGRSLTDGGDRVSRMDMRDSGNGVDGPGFN